MPHKHRGGRRRPSRQAAVAVAAACDDCAHLIGNPEPSEDGIRMAIIHVGHVPELEAEGWITTRPGPHEPPDVTCLHYHLEHWEGGHDSSCCGMDGG